MNRDQRFYFRIDGDVCRVIAIIPHPGLSSVPPASLIDPAAIAL
jgi:hypothetical protein